MVRPLQQAVSSPLQLVRPLLGRADRFGSLLDEAKCSREVALLASRCLSFVQGSFRTSGGQINDWSWCTRLARAEALGLGVSNQIVLASEFACKAHYLSLMPLRKPKR